jgi:cysteine desulfurase/selenocysteine lyase
MPPYQGGGSMIAQVQLPLGTTFNDVPTRFEAGTPDVGGAVALHAAIDFIDSLGLSAIEAFELELGTYLLEELKGISGLELYGPSQFPRIPVFAFNLKGQHASDVGFLLNQQGIAVRTGHHCTQPLLRKLKINGSIRASLSVYNNEQEIDSLIKGINKAKDLLQ